MHGTTCANGSALSTHRFWVSSTWICLLLHANEFQFKFSSLFLIVSESMKWMSQWNSEIVLISCGYSWTMILLGTVQSRSSASGKGRNTWQTWQGRGTWWEICTQLRLRSNMVGSGAQCWSSWCPLASSAWKAWAAVRAHQAWSPASHAKA